MSGCTGSQSPYPLTSGSPRVSGSPAIWPASRAGPPSAPLPPGLSPRVPGPPSDLASTSQTASRACPTTASLRSLHSTSTCCQLPTQGPPPADTPTFVVSPSHLAHHRPPSPGWMLAPERGPDNLPWPFLRGPSDPAVPGPPCHRHSASRGAGGFPDPPGGKSPPSSLSFNKAAVSCSRVPLAAGPALRPPPALSPTPSKRPEVGVGRSGETPGACADVRGPPRHTETPPGSLSLSPGLTHNSHFSQSRC